MKNVVITGSTKGIGRGLAEEFLKRGCNLVVSSRTQEAVDETVEALGKVYGADRVSGKSCNVSSLAETESLMEFAVKAFGCVDIVINNAGVSHETLTVRELDESVTRKVVLTNLQGTINAASAAIRTLKESEGVFYTFEGFGSDGMVRSGMSVYGATKRAVRYLTRSLKKECKDQNVRIGTISPGMVVTDLLIGDMPSRPAEEQSRLKGLYAILADRVDEVTPWIADKILKKQSLTVRWLSGPKVFFRFLSAPFRKSKRMKELFPE